MTDTATVIDRSTAAPRGRVPENPADLFAAVARVDPWPALRHHQDRHARVSPQFVVTRWLTLGPTDTPVMGPTDAQERRTIAVADGGRLVLDPFQPRLAESNCWFAMGRVIVSGLHVTRFARVVVELRRHAPGQAELTIRPRSRAMPLWGRRRQERYFDLVHRIADLISCDGARGFASRCWSVTPDGHGRREPTAMSPAVPPPSVSSVANPSS